MPSRRQGMESVSGGRVMKESELAEIFIDYFNDGYEVYSEVPAGGGIVDFVATDGTIYIGCEVKNSFGLTVMEQAFRRRGKLSLHLYMRTKEPR